jgi:hypothetical protein
VHDHDLVAILVIGAMCICDEARAFQKLLLFGVLVQAKHSSMSRQFTIEVRFKNVETRDPEGQA